MTILQCEACGAPLPVKGRTKTYTCEYCGTSQTITLPVTNKKADTMYNRALRYMKDYEDEYTYKKKKEKELKVKEYTNKIIDEFPDYAKAYVLLLMLKTRVYKEEELGDLTDDLSYYDAYQVIMEKGDPELKKRIRGYYLKALQPYILRQIDYADKIEELEETINLINERRTDFKRPDTLISTCHKKISVIKHVESEIEHIEKILSDANTKLNNKDDKTIVNNVLNEVRQYCKNRFSRYKYKPVIVEFKNEDSMFSYSSGTLIKFSRGIITKFVFQEKHELHVIMCECYVDAEDVKSAIIGEVPPDYKFEEETIGVDTYTPHETKLDSYAVDDVQLEKLPVLTMVPPTFFGKLSFEVKYLL